MDRILFIILILFLTLSFSCSVGNIKSGKTDRVGVVNIKTLYEYLLSQEKESLTLLKKNIDLKKRILSYNELIRQNNNRQIDSKVLEKKKIVNKELELNLNKIKKLKNRIYEKIDQLIKVTAQKNSIALILRKNRTIVFYKKEIDVTSLVIEELLKEKERRTPVSR